MINRSSEYIYKWRDKCPQGQREQHPETFKVLQKRKTEFEQLYLEKKIHSNLAHADPGHMTYTYAHVTQPTLRMAKFEFRHLVVIQFY